MANVLVEKQSLIDTADAIRAKLGTQALIAPEDFDTEIAKISGGDNEDPGDYGMVWFWPELAIVGEGYGSSYGCDFEIVDGSKLVKHMEIYDNKGSFQAYYFEDLWEVGYDEERYTTEEMLSVFGLSITNLEESASVNLSNYDIGPDTTEPMKKVRLNSAAEFALFTNDGNHDTITLHTGDEINPTSQVVRFAIGKTITELPEWFLYGYGALGVVDTSYANNVTTIGNTVFTNCKNLSCEMTFPSVTTIGRSFLGSAALFSGPVSLPEVTQIGNDAFYNTSIRELPKTPKVTTIGERYCANSAITYVIIDAISDVAVTIGQKAFESSSLTTLSFGSNSKPVPTSIGARFCGNCASLRSVSCYRSGTDLTNLLNAFSETTYTLSNYGNSNYSKLPVYIGGIGFDAGTATQNVKAEIKAKFPNISGTNNVYRKWQS